MIKLHRRVKPIFGTFVSIEIAKDDSKIFNEAFSEMMSIHQLLSLHSSSSELSQINSSYGSPIFLNKHSYKVLELAQHMMRESDGFFDVTIGRMLQDRRIIPMHAGQNQNESHGSWSDIELQDGFCFLKKPLTITLDGIAKGFAVDLAIAYLEKKGITRGIINAGGDLRIFGDIRLPLHVRTKHDIQFIGEFEKISIASSRYSNKKSKFFPGMIMSQSNKGLKNKLWTVSADEAWRADALTKVAATAPDHKREYLFEKLKGKIIHTSSL